MPADVQPVGHPEICRRSGRVAAGGRLVHGGEDLGPVRARDPPVDILEGVDVAQVGEALRVDARENLLDRPGTACEGKAGAGTLGLCAQGRQAGRSSRAGQEGLGHAPKKAASEKTTTKTIYRMKSRIWAEFLRLCRLTAWRAGKGRGLAWFAWRKKGPCTTLAALKLQAGRRRRSAAARSA